jgi:aspartate/glutamate racemase
MTLVPRRAIACRLRFRLTHVLHMAGAQAIMLGGIDLALAFNEKDAGFPIVDYAGIHADAITRLAIPG